jgi:predicted nucleic acid-binding Zn ribbon protein
MVANALVREGGVVICDYLMKECQHILEKRNKRKKDVLLVLHWGTGRDLLVDTGNLS